MSIEHASLWRGRFIETYIEEVHRWISNHSDSYEEDSLISLDLTRVRESDFNWSDQGLADESALFVSSINAILYNPHSLKAAEIAEVRKHFEAMDTPVTLALVQLEAGGKVLKDTKAMLTEENERERLVPFGSPSEQIDWIQSWLEARDVGISRADAKKIAQHSAESPEVQVNIVRSLASAFKGFDLEWDDIAPTFSELGYTDDWALSNAIVGGHSGDAIEAYRRNWGSAPARVVLGGLKSRYRLYGMVMESMESQNDLATRLKKNPYHIGYMISESRKLGRNRYIKSYRAIGRAEHRITVEFQNEDAVMEQLVAFLAKQFEFARRKR